MNLSVPKTIKLNCFPFSGAVILNLDWFCSSGNIWGCPQAFLVSIARGGRTGAAGRCWRCCWTSTDHRTSNPFPPHLLRQQSSKQRLPKPSTLRFGNLVLQAESLLVLVVSLEICSGLACSLNASPSLPFSTSSKHGGNRMVCSRSRGACLRCCHPSRCVSTTS